MANKLQNTSRKSPRRNTSKSVRQAEVKVRMNDEEIALLDTKRGTDSRSRFLRRALYDGRDNQRKLVTVHVPEIERAIIEMNRIGVNVNQIARQWNVESKKGSSWATTSMLMRMDEDAKTLAEHTRELQKTNELLSNIYEAIREQNADTQMDRLAFATSELLSDFDDSACSLEERHEVGGDV